MAKNIFPYELPANWQWATWEQCGKFIAGSGFKKEYQGLKNYEIPFYKVGSLKFSNSQGYIQDKDNTINKNILKILKAQLIPKDSLLFAKIGEAIRLNRRALNNVPCCIDNNMIAFIAEKILPRYVYYWSQSIDLYIYTNATTVPAIRKSDLEKIQIPLPPLDEQKRIVAIIESLFEKLDTAKSIVQKILDGYELRRAAILHKAFTGELTKNFRADNGLTLNAWQEKKLGEVCQINPPKISTQNLSDDLEVSFFPMASLSEVEGKITKPQIKRLGEVKRGYTNFSEGDVVFAKITPCMENGKSAIIEKLVNSIGYGTTEFFVMRCSEGILNKFLHHLIRGKKFRDEAKEVMAGAVGQLRVPKNFLINYEINLPPFDEQKEIVRVLDGLLDKERRTKEIAEKILSEIDLLKRTILARAFRGELGTNNPSEKLEELY